MGKLDSFMSSKENSPVKFKETKEGGIQTLSEEKLTELTESQLEILKKEKKELRLQDIVAKRQAKFNAMQSQFELIADLSEDDSHPEPSLQAPENMESLPHDYSMEAR